MRLGVMMEGYVPKGSTPTQRVREMVEQAKVAEEVGLDSFMVSEQHFKFHTNSISQPDIFLMVVARETERIRIVPGVLVLPLHHPLHVAERIAFLDIFSEGRVDFGVGRGNTSVTADVFDVPMGETEAKSVETLDIILKAWREGSYDRRFSYQGQYYSFENVAVTPQPLQHPHPPVWWAATSPDAHERGGEYGYNLITGANAIDWGQSQRRIDRFNAGVAKWRETNPDAGRPQVRLNLHGFCAPDTQDAIDLYRPYVMEYVDRTVSQYREAVRRSGRTVDFSKSERFQKDFDALRQDSPVAIGNPDVIVEQLLRVKQMGVDEVTFRLDGPTHEQILTCIELLGKEVRDAVHSG